MNPHSGTPVLAFLFAYSTATTGAYYIGFCASRLRLLHCGLTYLWLQEASRARVPSLEIALEEVRQDAARIDAAREAPMHYEMSVGSEDTRASASANLEHRLQ